jgi:hypothetical protein
MRSFSFGQGWLSQVANTPNTGNAAIQVGSFLADGYYSINDRRRSGGGWSATAQEVKKIMERNRKTTRGWLVLGLSALLTAGITAVDFQPANAARRGDHDGDGIRNRNDRDRDGDGVRNRMDRFPNNPNRRGRDIDRDGIRNSRDTDRDGDGVRNKRDRHPNQPRRSDHDYDRDGIRNKWDRDRDGDGIRNKWDRSPNRPGNGNYRYNGRNGWYGQYGQGRWNRGRSDRDHDGITDSRDWDRDGDGVSNRRDRYPDNRNRR